MKQLNYFICCGLSVILLTGFDSGIEAEKVKDIQASPSGPILEYEEPIVPQESTQDLYHQYHLLVITSLEEASSSLAKDPAWSYHMAQNAYNYIKLLRKLLKEEYKDGFVDIIKDLKALMSDMKNRRLSGSKRNKIAEELGALADNLENNFDFGKMQTWLKN